MSLFGIGGWLGDVASSPFGVVSGLAGVVGGTGIGLTMTQDLVNLAGGLLGASNRYSGAKIPVSSYGLKQEDIAGFKTSALGASDMWKDKVDLLSGAGSMGLNLGGIMGTLNIPGTFSQSGQNITALYETFQNYLQGVEKQKAGFQNYLNLVGEKGKGREATLLIPQTSAKDQSTLLGQSTATNSTLLGG